MSRLSIDIQRTFDSGFALHARLDLDLARHPVTVLFGPSGSGKTSILRAIAGLDTAATGRIALDDEPWLDSASHRFTSPQHRRLGYVIQDPALFPHLSVADNIAYGLHALPRPDRDARVSEMVRLVGVAGLESRRPGELSGGQRQRVAIARALAIRPRLLLMDEPLASLDDAARVALRSSLRRLLADAGGGTPAIIVTHDHAEALALADAAAIVTTGQVRQVGPIEDVFSRPADESVAAAVGVETVVAGEIIETTDGMSEVAIGPARLSAVNPPLGSTQHLTGRVLVAIRAADVALSITPDPRASPRTRLGGVVTAIEPGPAVVRVHLDCGFPLAALITRASAADLALAPGSRLTASIKAMNVHMLPRE